MNSLILDLRPKSKRRMGSANKARKFKLLMAAQRGICAHCEEPFPATYGDNDPERPTLDHVTPHSADGSNAIENLLLKHRHCNEYCGARPPSKRDRKWQKVVSDYRKALARLPGVPGAFGKTKPS